MPDLDLSRYLRALVRWWCLIVTTTLVAAIAAYVGSQFAIPTYRTSITLMVGEEQANPNATPDQAMLSQRLAAQYVEMARRQPVLEATVKAVALGIDWRELRERVLVVHREGSQIFEVRVVDNSPARAKATVDEIARQLIAQSPAAESARKIEEHRQFVQGQLDNLQKEISAAQIELSAKQDALAKETSARGVLDRQDEIKALELKLSSWRAAYASLLASFNQARAANALSIIESSFVPSEPVSPNVKANVLLAAALGLLLALAVVSGLEYFHDTMASNDDVTRALGLSTLASIARWPTVASAMLGPVLQREPRSPIAEAYRTLRANVQFACTDMDELVLLVTSSLASEGKSVTCANLATSFAQAGKRTIVVDADLRHPSLHKIFSCSNTVGLTTLFFDDASAGGPEDNGGPRSSERKQMRARVEACLQATEVPNLRLLASGPLPATPAEMLGSRRMGQLIDHLCGAADVVIFDSPPLLPVADGAILAANVSGVIMVVEAGRTRARLARLATASLKSAHARVLGVVLNKVARSSVGYYYRYPYGQKRRGIAREWRLGPLSVHTGGNGSGAPPRISPPTSASGSDSDGPLGRGSALQ